MYSVCVVDRRTAFCRGKQPRFFLNQGNHKYDVYFIPMGSVQWPFLHIKKQQ